MNSMETFPPIGEAGINTFFNGPESFTNDNLHLLGPTPEVDNFWVACGMNSKGIGAGGGMGKIMADWIIDGYPSGDILECDVRRNQPVQKTQSYVEERIPEALGHTYDMHWPFYQYKTSRDLVLSPMHETLKAQGACFGEVGGYERPNWFARDGAKAEYEWSYKRQNWFEFYAAEHMAMRENVGIYDISSFGKFEVTGPDAQAALQYICAGDLNVEPGKLVYTQWLNPQGGIEADVTVAKMADDVFFVTTGVASTYRDYWYLKKNLRGDVKLVDTTSKYACLSIQGPNSRAVLTEIAETDMSMEKGFRHWGHDIGPADNMIQAGLGFAAKPDASDFIGRDAFVAAKAAGVPDRRTLQFKLDDPGPLLYHNESIIMDGEIVGYLTSGMYGHAVGGALGMGYAEVPGLTADKIAEGTWEIEIATERFSAQAQLRAFYDPKGEKMRS